MQDQASQLITMLYTDIEGSTERWEHFPQAMHAVLARHDAMLQRAIAEHRGKIVVTTGDGVLAVFESAGDAVQAALAAQAALGAADWHDVGGLKVRMGLHTGEAVETQGNYHAPALNRGARLMAAGHGGQILLSAATYELIRDQLPLGVELRDLGEHRLKDLVRPEHVFQIGAAEAAREFAPLKTADERPTNLPLEVTSLIGREQEAAQLQALLRRDDVRLVTLTGVGGVGKTRLSLRVAAELLEEFRDGVFFVELAPVSDTQLVPPAIAQALGVKESGDKPLRDSVAAFLRDKHLLLVLDNFEHVLGAAPVLGVLLQSAARLKVLVSSRIVLHVYGELEYAVQPLPVLEPRLLTAGLETVCQCPAVKMFIARSQLVKPDFVLTHETAPAVAEICTRLDGLPLAIELAAARIKVLPPQALLARLESRLKVLTGGARDLPARQQTVRGAIDWSYELLDGAEKELFAWLSVFAGGWTMAAAEAVWSATDDQSLDLLDGLSSLVDKSLVRQEDRGPHGEPRFSMLEMLREYAAERLVASGAWGTARRAHAGYFLALVEEAEPHLTRAEQVEWLARLEDEHDNLRAVLRWALDGGEVALGLRLAGLTGQFWWLRGYLSEARGWLEALLASTPAPGAAGVRNDRARALWQAARFADAQGDTKRAEVLAEESRNLYRDLEDSRGLAAALSVLGGVANRQGDYPQALALHEESLALCRALGDSYGVAWSLNNLGIITARQGNYQRALELHEESLGLRRALGDRWGIAASLNNLALAVADQGDYARAQALYTESLALRRALGDKSGIAYSLSNLGLIATEQGDYPRAEALHQESLALRRELGDTSGIAISLLSLGWLAVEQHNYALAARLETEGLALHWKLGDKRWIAISFEALAEVASSSDGAQGSLQQAVQLFGAAAALRTAIGAPVEPADQDRYDRNLLIARTALSESAFQRAWDAGQRAPLEQVVAQALAGTSPT